MPQLMQLSRPCRSTTVCSRPRRWSARRPRRNTTGGSRSISPGASHRPATRRRSSTRESTNCKWEDGGGSGKSDYAAPVSASTGAFELVPSCWPKSTRSQMQRPICRGLTSVDILTPLPTCRHGMDRRFCALCNGPSQAGRREIVESRARKHSPRNAADLPNLQPSPEQLVLSRSLVRCAPRTIALLTPRLRDTFLLAASGGLDTAAAIGDDCRAMPATNMGAGRSGPRR